MALLPEQTKQYKVRLLTSSSQLFPRVLAEATVVKTQANVVRLDHLIGGRFMFKKIIVVGKSDVVVINEDNATVVVNIPNRRTSADWSDRRFDSLPLNFRCAIGYTAGLKNIILELEAPNGQLHRIYVA